jgi:hypothetical protein
VVVAPASADARFGWQEANQLHDVWLNVPQAVVLEVTGNLRQASKLKADDPNLLMIKAIWRLPPLTSIEVDGFPNEMETLRQRYRMVVDSRVQESGYENGLQRVHAKLMQGVTTKGSRAPHLPLEVIDPAEFARLALRGIDAVDIRTGKTVWHGIVISAREQLDGSSEEPWRTEFHPRSRQLNWLEGDLSFACEAAACADTPLLRVRVGTAPLSDRDLRLWYQQRIEELISSGETASGEGDWEVVKGRFPGRVTRARLRALRDELAPEHWKRQGRRSPAATK